MFKVHLRYPLVFLLGIILTLDANSQYFPSRQYTTTDGMPSPGVFDITQSANGVMWFMTKSGPMYYNAKEWVTFPDSLNLPSSNNSKIVSSGNNIWVAGLSDTTLSIQYFSDQWYKISPPFESQNLYYDISFNVCENNGAKRVLLGNKNRLWIYHTDDKTWKRFSFDGQRVNDIRTIGDQCLVTTSDGVFQYKNDTLEVFRLPYDQLPNKTILTLTKSNDKIHLLGSDWYAEVINNNIELLIEGVGLSEAPKGYQSSLVVNDDVVLFGAHTPARIIDRKNKTWNDLPIGGEIVNIGSTRIFKDQESNIWVSDSRGLFKFNILRFVNYNKNSGLVENEVSAIKELSNGLMLVANPRQLNVMDGNSIENIRLGSEGDLGYRVLDIEEDPQLKEVYMANSIGGLLIYKNDQFSKPIQTINFDRLRPTSVERHRDKLYVTGYYGLYEFINRKLQIVDSLTSIRNIISLGDKLALLSNSRGVYLYDGNSFTHYSSKNFDLNSVYDIVIYKGDTLLATRDGIGIARNGVISHALKYTQKYPTYSLLVDRKGRLWGGTDRGIFMFDNDRSTFFGVNEGLAGREVNRNAFLEDNNENIWIGTESGASVFKGGRTSQELNLNVEVTGIISGKGKTLTRSNEIALPYDDNEMRITFQCASYVNEDKINFRYRIGQSGKKWVKLSNAQNDIIFRNLSYGEASFEIQARYGLEAWGPVTSFDFIVLKPFYLKWWFIALALIAVFITGRTIFYFRYLYLIRQKEKLKREVQARTKEISELNENLEEKVIQRTRELEEKNKRLQEYAYINAHYLRGPLTKIMSVLHLQKLERETQINKKYIEILQEAVDELDEVIHSITDRLDLD